VAQTDCERGAEKKDGTKFLIEAYSTVHIGQKFKVFLHKSKCWITFFNPDCNPGWQIGLFSTIQSKNGFGLSM
jgi:hypothetical protein